MFPEEAFLGRKVRVEVTGDATSWNANTTLNFGDGITVGAIEVVSPSALQVDLTIAATAPGGAHDVTVTAGSDVLTLPGAFTLKAPLMVEAASSFEQGGFGEILITNLDRLNPFDSSTNANGDFLLTVDNADSGVALSVIDVTDNTITLSAGIDVLATTTGALTISSSGVVSPADAVPVKARTPQPITVGTPANFTMAANGSLLEITAASAGMLHIELTTTDTANADSPAFGLVPTSGKLDDVLIVHQNFGGRAALDNRVVAAGDKFYLIAFENGFFGAPGYQAKFEARIVDLTGVTAVTDTGTNDTPNTAQVLSGVVAQFDGVLANANDKDCFKINTGAANKRIHVFTTDENGASDTVIEVFGNDTELAPLLVTSDDADFGEDVVTGVLAAPILRSICVKPSEFAPTGFTNAPYKAFVVIE
ncbi:MAG: hypothetical protein KF773_36410 [Deltaproteobacteria bacterium]|nr:hypothetical protein [Deltaproteobacteria bacterium]